MKKLTALILSAAMFISGTALAVVTNLPPDADGHWAQPAIEWAIEERLICGKNSHEWAPDDTLTRAELATILHRQTLDVEQRPQCSGFKITPEGNYYHKEFDQFYFLGIREHQGEAKHWYESKVRCEAPWEIEVEGRVRMLTYSDGPSLEVGQVVRLRIKDSSIAFPEPTIIKCEVR